MPSEDRYSGGSCIRCGYPLRDLAEPRCPECGREFDPGDPKTFRQGRPMSRLSRLILRPIGWHWVILAVLSAGAVLLATRWPTRWGAPFSDLPIYWLMAQNPWAIFTATDWFYVIGLPLMAGVMLVWLVRVVMQVAVSHRVGPLKEDRVDQRRRHVLILLAGAATTAMAAFGWPFRMARQWAISVLQNSWPYLPVGRLSAKDQLAVVRSAVLQLPNAVERLAGLKLLVEEFSREDVRTILLEALHRETDPQNIAWLLRLAGVLRDDSMLTAIEPFLNHSNPSISEAAIDAVGLICMPSYLQQAYMFEGQQTSSQPRIGLHRLRWLSNSTEQMHDLPGSLRPRLVEFVLNGRTTELRHAAARVLVTWPPAGYRLRVAEWGVLIASGSYYGLPKSIIEEIPPFVHQTGDLSAELAARQTLLTVITKPIIHITTDQLMAVDIEVKIHRGRPWFAFPMPDDFGLSVDVIGLIYGNYELAQFDNPSLKPLDDAAEGYRWMYPSHRAYRRGGIFAVGLRWQSLIVTPRQQRWMRPPAVPGQAKYQWWSRLREVPCSWVWNRGEAERFLYYDGPTAATAPIKVSRRETTLDFVIPASPDLASRFPRQAEKAGNKVPIEGLFVEHKGGQITTATVFNAEGPCSLNIDPKPCDESWAAAQLLDMLVARGLTSEEAMGLIDAWRPQFFRTAGSRFIMLMSPADYDELCPIQVRPKPTQLVRVGIILTEFQDQPA